ncbi:MAG TPA: sigma-54-dependent Fis family transcriptional regulator [Caldithrix abyssi]|uniref:Sigma-54-dependent Fis family transcriptional regulator n=1 Tax=Caldithrix abyssi TaxID=187145 RepID=A0A7V4U472_CALAY|nr:sigma-54-dependent Fis family transcriptional regulator [Caldithrix abyssi]
MHSKTAFISNRIDFYQNLIKERQSALYDADLFDHVEANRKLIYQSYYKLFIVDFDTPFLAVPPWLREQSHHEYYYLFIFLTEKPITAELQQLVGNRLFRVINPKLALHELPEIMEEANRLIREHRYPQENNLNVNSVVSGGLLGFHPAIRSINNYIEIISKARFAPCLIRGETGTGKNLCARLIHKSGGLDESQFYEINCENRTTNDLLREFFGEDNHPDGQRIGLFEKYAGGTLVLKNIEKLPREVQDKLLLVMEDHVYRPLDSNRVVESRIRLIGTTKHNLEWFVKQQNFNSGLYYYLNAFEIHLPPLRERKEDIELFAHYYMQSFSYLYAKKITSFSPSAMNVLKDYKWPGNIRELKDVIERAVFTSTSEQITNKSFPETLSYKIETSSDEEHFGNCSIREIEKIHIKQVLMNTNGNKSRAASILDISRTTLREKMRQYGLN